MSELVFKNVSPFDLAQTLDCGQSFRFKENADGSFTGVVRDVVATVSCENETLKIVSNSDLNEQMWRE